MNKQVISWTIALFISIGLVIIIRLLFIRIQTVQDNSMKHALVLHDKAICLKSKRLERNSIILVRWSSESNQSFKRIIGMPMDTIIIRQSIVYINGIRQIDDPDVTFLYKFSTDSISHAIKLLNKKNIEFDTQLASIGVFQFEANLNDLKQIKNDSLFYNIKRVISDPTIALLKSNELNNFYWNNDNIGPLIVPGKGARIRITSKNIHLYRQIIESESDKKLNLIDNKVCLSKIPLDFFTFRHNYYFVLNDNRQNTADSRTKGFISGNEISAKLWFKLPW